MTILVAFGVGLIVAYGSVAALIILLSVGRVSAPPRMPKSKPVSEQIPEQIRGGGQIREADWVDVGGIGDAPIYMYGVTGEER